MLPVELIFVVGINLIKLCAANQMLKVQDDSSIDGINESDNRMTFPGTKWCGPGDVASSYDDLGQFEATDKCCRAHDNCDNIPSGESKYGLTNNDLFTVLHCDCDRSFFNCLHSSNDKAGTVVGEKYFLVRSRCYREEYPIKGCLEYDRLLVFRRCVKYDLDTSQPKQYQWFNLPFYTTEKFPNSLRIKQRFSGETNNIEDYPAYYD